MNFYSDFNFQNCDWFAEDPINREFFYIKDNALYRQEKNNNELNNEKIQNNVKNVKNEKNEKILYSNTKRISDNITCNTPTNYPSKKFSSMLSGKNILISGGGTIATLGKANIEDYAIVNNITPKGSVFLEFICPISCQGLLFGMCSLDPNNLTQSAQNILISEKKSFKSFRTSSRRRVGMEIDYSARRVKFYLEGIAKDKNIDFSANCNYPCVIITSRNASVVLNTFAKHNNLDFPLYLSPSGDDSTSTFNILNKFLFIVDVSNVSSQSFDKENFVHAHFKFDNLNGKFPPDSIFIPINTDTKSLEGFIAIRFQNDTEMQDFKTVNKDVKINEKNVIFLERHLIENIVRKNCFKTFKLDKLCGKEDSTGNLSITKRNLWNEVRSALINDYEVMITKWFLNEYFDINITGEKTLYDINKNVENAIEEVNKKSVGDKSVQSKEYFNTHNDNKNIAFSSGRQSSEPNKLIVEYLPLNDTLLLIDDSEVKVFSRNSSGNFDFNFYSIGQNVQNVQNGQINIANNDSLEVILNTKDLLRIINTIPWKTLLSDSTDYNQVISIDSFFSSLKTIKFVNDLLSSLHIDKTLSLIFIEAVLSYLNKSTIITKDKEKIQANLLKSTAEVNVNLDKEINSELPFAPDYPIEELKSEDIAQTASLFDNYNLSDTEVTLSLYKTLLQFAEQVRLNTDRTFNDISWASSFSRLSTFVNYPFINQITPNVLSDKGLYIDNTLTNELKLYGYNHIKLFQTKPIKDSESLDKIIEQQFPFNYMSKTNFFPNVELSYSINALASRPQLDTSDANNINKKLSISHFNKSAKVPLIITTSENGTTSIWNYSFGLNLLSNLNIKKGIKQVNDFKDIIQINWLKESSSYKSLAEVLLEEKFEVVKVKAEEKNELIVDFNTVPTGKLIPNPKKEKEIVVNQEMVNNLYIMGFSLDACKHALKETKNNFDKALEFLLEKSGDMDFMSKFTPKEVEKDIKIAPWQCSECTFLNEKGEFTCEICGTGIPDKTLKEFMDSKARRQEEGISRETKEASNEIIESKDKEETLIHFKDCLVKNVHLFYDNSDPVAPFIVTAVLFDVVLNKMILSTYKLMINPVSLRDFISIGEKDSFICRIDNRRHQRLEDAIAYLNDKYFTNLHSLYPQFVGKANTLPTDSFFKHLIPIEHSYIEIPVTSFFDSFSYEDSTLGSNLSVLVEIQQGTVSLLNFNIKNKYKFNLITSKSLEIDYAACDNIQNMFTNLYPAELKVLRDNCYYYVITQDSVIQLNREFKLEKTFDLDKKQIGLFKKVEPIFEAGVIKEIRVNDDVNGLIVVRVRVDNQKENEKNIKVWEMSSTDAECSSSGDFEAKVKNLKVEDLSYAELNVLPQLLDFERISFKLDGRDESKTGLINSSSHTEYKKVYIDLRNEKERKFQTKLDFSKPSQKVVSNLEFVLKPKSKKFVKLGPNIKSSNDNMPRDINMNMNTELSQKEVSELKNLVPLTVLDFKGSQSQVNVNVSSLLFGEGRFITNYARPDFLFSHLHDYTMNIESLIIGSETSSKIGEIPLGEGLVFLLNDLESIHLAREFANFTQKDFDIFVEKKQDEEIFEWEPLCYVNLGATEFVRSKVFKTRPCKYIYFLPTNGRKSPKDFRGGFNQQMMSLIMFAAEGTVNSRKNEDLEYLNQHSERKLVIDDMESKTEIKVSVSGFSEGGYLLFDEKSSLNINAIIPNTYSGLDKTDLLVCKLKITNNSHSERLFNNLLFEIENSDLNYDLLGLTVETLTFKSINKLKECKNLQDLDLHQLRKVIIEKDQFDLFNKKFVQSLFQSEVESKKRLLILKYLKYLIARIPSVCLPIESSFDFNDFLRSSILQSSSSDLINNCLDFLRLIRTENSDQMLEKAIVDILDNLPSIRFSFIGFRSFISLFSIMHVDDSVLMEKAFKIISSSLSSIKENQFQTVENIFLKSHLKIEETPFDSNVFNGSGSGSNAVVRSDGEGFINISESNVIQSSILAEIHNDTLRLNVDLQKVHKVASLKLLFSASETVDSHFRVFVWGDSHKVKSENFNLIDFKSYMDHTWKQLTKYETLSLSNRDTLFNTSDIRSIVLDELDFTGRYLLIEIVISNGEKQTREFPASLYIFPQVTGEVLIDVDNYHYKKFEEMFINFMSITTQEVTFNKRKHAVKLGTDASKYLLVGAQKECNGGGAEELNEISKTGDALDLVKSHSQPAQTDNAKLRQTLKSYQNSLEKLISDIVKRREPVDQPSQSKIKTLVEDITTIQVKINSYCPLMKLSDSLSINIHVLTIFTKHLCSLASKSASHFKSAFDCCFPSNADKQNFILNLIEVCVINNSGELLHEALSLLKNFIWVCLRESTGEEISDNLFDSIVENYLTKDIFYRSALQIVEALSFIDFSVDIILTKLKEAFRKNWSEEQIPDAFFNISSLIILLIMKLKNKDSQISKKCVDIINVNLEFIKYLTKESKFNKDINDIILAHSLNLLQESFKTTDFETLNKIINPELIEYMVYTMFELWENSDIKSKLIGIIDKLINPFNGKKNDETSKLLCDRITLNTQILTINFIDSLLTDSEISDDRTNKLDYILNLLIKTYSINSQLQEKMTNDTANESEESIQIKKKNSEIILKFIEVILKFNQTNKIGYSTANNFWKYLTEILGRGSLEMLFYNNIFSNLILNSFLHFDVSLQELLYTKFVKVFQNLYTKSSLTPTQEMFDQITTVILHMLQTSCGTQTEHVLIPFITQLSEIILCGETPLLDSKTFTSNFRVSEKLKTRLFIEISTYLCQYVNLASFTGANSSIKTVYNRVVLARTLMQLMSTFVNDYLNNITEKDITNDFRSSIRNYLIFLVFDYYMESPNQSPVLVKTAKTWVYVQNIIDLCSKRKKLIEVMLQEFMKVVRKVDDQIFTAIRSNKIALKKGIVISDKLFSTLEQVLNKCLQDDEITKFFAFELQGFKFFIDRVNTHRKHLMYSGSNTNANARSNQNYKLNSDLLKSLTIEVNAKDASEKEKEDDTMYNGNLNDYAYEEFAVNNKFNLLEGDVSNPSSNVISNINWSSKKKGGSSVVHTREMKGRNYHEEQFLFQINHLIEVKDVFIGFNFNITNIADTLAGIVPTVYLEAGSSLDKMDLCVKLERIDDTTYLEKSVVVFGFNFYSFWPDLVKVDDNYLENLLNQLLNCRAKYFRFIVRRPHLLSNENSHNPKISFNNVVLGINHISINGSKIADTQKVLEHIQEKEKNVSIKLISKIFTAEFIDTLKYIAKDSSTIDNIKQIYDAFEPYINKHATILSNILINVSKYNFELGEWLLNRLLSMDNSEIHAKLAVEITQNNEEYVNERINKYLAFILRELSPSSALFFSHDVENKLKNIGKFAHFFTVSLNGLLISPFQTKVIDLNIDFDAFLGIIKNMQKYSAISSEVQNLITVLLIPNKKLRMNEFLDPSESTLLLHELYTNTYIFDYIDILSYLVSNSEIYEKICQKKRLLHFYCEEFIRQVNANLRGKNMLALMNVLKNMSYSQAFVSVVREENYDFKILDAVKNKNEKSDSILINNNLNFLTNLVIFMRNCIIDHPDCLRRLAELLIEDLEICKKKIDKVYANNVLMPLLRMEKSVNVCIHPVDSFLNTIFSSYCNLTQSQEEKQEKHGVEVSSTTSVTSSSLSSNEPYLAGTMLPTKIASQFKELFTSFEYTPKKTFANEKFKLAFSSKTITDKNNMLSALSQAVSNAGPFLLVLYPTKSTSTPEADLFTFFYCGGTLPSLPSSLNLNDSNTLNIPYTNQNFIAQIQGSNFITAHLNPEYDENNGKEYEIGYINYDSYSANMNISGDIIVICLLDLVSSAVNPYPEAVTVFKSNGLNSLKYTGLKDFEVFISTSKEPSKSSDSIQTSSKIISTKYIDESGNLNFEKVQTMKYFKKNHPLLVLRNNPVIEIPDNVTVKLLKEFLISSNVQLMTLEDQNVLENDANLLSLQQSVCAIKDSKILDISYDIPTLRGILGNPEQPLTSIPNYEPKLPVFESFEKLDGIRKIVSVLKSSISMWKNKAAIQSWIKWVDDVEKFSELPSFFATLIRHQKCFDMIFNLLCGLYDNENSYKEVGFDASKYIYEILNDSFIATQSAELRKCAIEKGIFANILERLQTLTREKPRRYAPGTEVGESSSTGTANANVTTTTTTTTTSTSPKDPKEKDKDGSKTKKSTKKGVGYGSDHTGDNKTWDVATYLEGKKSNSQQIASIINLLTNFFTSTEIKMTEDLKQLMLESPILPVLESAFRGATILELAKEDTVYFAYLNMTLKLSENGSLVPFLLDISKDFKPVQTDSVFTLLSQLNEGAKIFISCFKKKGEEKTIEEKIALEITRTFEQVSKNVKAFQTNLQMDKHYGEILKLPVEKSYVQLMRELSFDYMSMKDNNGKIVHHYAGSVGGEATSSKMIRLAQEYADLSRSLPCEHTNAIFIRVDKDNMDLMKALIMGSAGTPYGHGAFEFDIYFDSQYPNGPPKVNLMTTGHGSVRFNPNLYANGKVCLSLLGTWRGQSTENWDAKISTLLQVLISIQSIIMSDLVYFNEPSCESEMGKPEGEAKNEAYSNIVRYCNVKYAMLEQVKTPTKGFEEVIRRHFYLKKNLILQEVKGWIERSKTTEAKYSSFSYDHNPTWAQKMTNAKQYTKMLEDVYAELEKELNDLPLPSELKRKTEESEKLAQEKAKKKEKMEFISLDNVDVTYDNENVQVKEININDEAVKDRWSRYIGAMGIDAVQRQANSSVFISGANGLGIEISKNLVLSGCKKFVLHDTRKTSYYDLSSQFFLTEDDININRAEACIKKLQQLNYYVKILASTAYLPKTESELDKFGLKDFTIVILTQCDYETAVVINKYCRKRGIHFISTDLYGVFGRVINDFGEKFTVNDKDGEDLKDCMIKSIDKEGVVTVLEGTRHNFQDGDEVAISEVVGMNSVIGEINSDSNSNGENANSINETKHIVKVINPQSFRIGDTSKYTDYIRNGMAKQIKSIKELAFKDLEYVLNNNELSCDENMSIADFTKMSNSIPLHIGFEALDSYNKSHKSLPSPWSIPDSKEILTLAKKISEKFLYQLTDKDTKLIQYLSFTSQTQFSPLSAFFGGLVAQEAVKAMTGKFTPIYQLFYYDAVEVLPEINMDKLEESVKSVQFEEKKNRSDGLQVIVGSQTLKAISEMKIMVVGAGAIGCELLKNFAMLEVGTSNEGSIVVTDPDVIEVSNLNRQFLFREKHLRQPKSSTAAAAIMQMNRNLKNHVFVRMDKLQEETEHIFTDKFFSGLSLVANALDNIQARRYVDSRCVSNRIPLLESGTLGAKGHVQVVIPFKTESYASQQDPEVSTDIPQCTLKMFPEEAMHCVEWARDQFGKLFTQKPKTVNKMIEEGVENQELKVIKQVVKHLKKAPKDFSDCIRLAREKFQKMFHNNIKQLMFAYPLDKKNKDGSLFWNLPKRPPVYLEFDAKNSLHASFIAAYACLYASEFKVKIPYDNPRKDESKFDMASKASLLVMPEFKPNELKAKEIEKEVEKQKKDDKIEEESSKNVDTGMISIDNEPDLNELSKEFISLVNSSDKSLVSEEFEKDNDANFHIDLIHSMSNLRCRNYKLEEMDWMTVKIKAGRIIPALATTTAAIAGLQSLELVKIAKRLDIEQIRNSFINLAIPFLQASEPGTVSKTKLKDDLEVTLWDRWEVHPDALTLKSVYQFLQKKFNLYPRDCFKGKKAIFAYMAYEGEEKKSIREETMNKNLVSLMGVTSEDEYVDAMITFTSEESSDVYLKNVPIVRIYLK